jgi:two-component system, OmpR family, KDP operon response regulator KdpE
VNESRGRLRVLVVDDEPSILLALRMALGRAGFEVLTAQSGESAHAMMAVETVDLLLIDLRMPDLRGDVVFHLAVSEQPHLAGQTLFFTGDVTERATTIIAGCGCPFVRKPFDLRDVIEALRALSPRKQSASA